MVSRHAVVTQIYRYPVKSMRATQCQEARVSEYGIVGDRQFAVTVGGRLVNQKSVPALATVTAQWRLDGGLALHAAGFEPCFVSTAADTTAARVSVDLYGSTVDAQVQHATANAWLSRVLGCEAALVRLSETFERRIGLELLSPVNGTQQNAFSDVAPLLIVNETSLDALNARLAEPVSIDRFRANIVVRSDPPFAEDDWRELDAAAGGFSLQAVAACERCAIVTTDQLTGERSAEPLQTLKRFRSREPRYSSGIRFGLYMRVSGEGSLAVGDRFGVRAKGQIKKTAS